ncbi:hypothetical protein [Vibrio algarum]|uniref:Uncharacterized protein n=1 Tax=Vibrio algarum TaxID=3020714 RepID=A0ABT4YNW6_9VIBR|nr:hypothetical protein [Vibrio sp. KJ40-1]MDB1123145.1 hypothetical protein [Vibrio sp. KJ40-1]
MRLDFHFRGDDAIFEQIGLFPQGSKSFMEVGGFVVIGVFS